MRETETRQIVELMYKPSEGFEFFPYIHWPPIQIPCPRALSLYNTLPSIPYYDEPCVYLFDLSRDDASRFQGWRLEVLSGFTRTRIGSFSQGGLKKALETAAAILRGLAAAMPSKPARLRVSGTLLKIGGVEIELVTRAAGWNLSENEKNRATDSSYGSSLPHT